MRTKLWTVYSRLSAEMRLLWLSRTKLLKSMKHSRKEEPPKEDARMDYMTRQRRKLKHLEVKRAMHPRVQRNYLLEEKYWEPGLLTESYLFHCFTHCGTTSVLLFWFVCLLCGVFFVVFVWWLVFPLFSIWCTRSSFIPRLSPSSWWAQHRSKKKVYRGTFCRRRCSESRNFLLSLRAIIVSPFHLSWDYQCFGWCFGLFAFLGDGFCCCMLFGWLTGFPDLWIWDAQVRRPFQDCHHRHDERSNAAKRN